MFMNYTFLSLMHFGAIAEPNLPTRNNNMIPAPTNGIQNSRQSSMSLRPSIISCKLPSRMNSTTSNVALTKLMIHTDSKAAHEIVPAVLARFFLHGLTIRWCKRARKDIIVIISNLSMILWT